MKRHPKSLFDALGETSATASLLARVRASERLAQTLSRSGVSVPGFDPLAPGHCELRGRTLHLRAPSSAVAAKLRQSLPTLLAAVQRTGADVIEIKVRVQLGQAAYPNEVSVKTASSDNAPRSQNLKSARQFADTLARELGDSALGQAAHKLKQTLGRLA